MAFAATCVIAVTFSHGEMPLLMAALMAALMVPTRSEH
jgi:hypothetical protein